MIAFVSHFRKHKHLLRSYYTNKYWKKQYQNIPATKYTILHASCLQNVMQTIESQVLPLYLTLALTPPPLPHFFFFFLLFKKIVAVENKYSVLDLPGNKFSGQVRDENK